MPTPGLEPMSSRFPDPGFRDPGREPLAFMPGKVQGGEHALAEPKKLRYRLLHVAARLVRTARRTILRIAHTWPWANELANEYARLVALLRPTGWPLNPGRPQRTQERAD